MTHSHTQTLCKSVLTWIHVDCDQRRDERREKEMKMDREKKRGRTKSETERRRQGFVKERGGRVRRREEEKDWTV